MPNPFAFGNNINTTLASAITTTSQTTVVLASSSNLPALSGGQYLAITLNDAATQTFFEIIYVTAIVGATLTVLRGQEGTAARTWLVGDYAYGAETAGILGQFAQLVNGGGAIDTSSTNQSKTGSFTAGGLSSTAGLVAATSLSVGTTAAISGATTTNGLASTADMSITESYPGLTLSGSEGTGLNVVVREILGNCWIMVNADYNSGTAKFSQTNTSYPSTALEVSSGPSIIRYAQVPGTSTPWSTWPATQQGTLAPVYTGAGTAAPTLFHFPFGTFTGTGGTVTATFSGLAFTGTGTFGAIAVNISNGGIIGGVSASTASATFASTVNTQSYFYIAFGY
jgi:hypothetical protein